MDVKKEKNLYAPRTVASSLVVPPMNFVAVDGVGDPKGQSYQMAMQLLYGLSFTIKMAPKGGKLIKGYDEPYTVPPLEGLWTCKGDRGDWTWVSMIRLPEFVDQDLFDWAKGQVATKKKLDVSGLRYFTYDEGLCVQILHIGPYSEETRSFALMDAYCKDAAIERKNGIHHELYLSNPRKTASEKLKTILRYQVTKVNV
ncbi:MAG: GyrI-like domain-containing protein [Sphaerochaetaceae bacterium]